MAAQMRSETTCPGIFQLARLRGFHDEVGNHRVRIRAAQVDRQWIVNTHPARRRVHNEVVRRLCGWPAPTYQGRGSARMQGGFKSLQRFRIAVEQIK
jgi:hypothetical protein